MPRLRSLILAAAALGPGLLAGPAAASDWAGRIVSSDPALRLRAAYDWSGLPEAEPERRRVLLNAAASPQWHVRRSAAAALGESLLPPGEAIPRLIELLDDPELPVASQAVVALSKLGSEAAPALIEKLEDGRPPGAAWGWTDSRISVRITRGDPAAAGLILAGSAAVSSLERRLEADLARLGDEPTGPSEPSPAPIYPLGGRVVWESAAAPTPLEAVQRDLYLLARIGRPAVPVVARQIAHPSPAVSDFALRHLLALGADQLGADVMQAMLEVLVGRVRESDDETRSISIERLGQLAGLYPAALDALAAMAHELTGASAESAARRLGKLGVGAQAQVRRLLQSDDRAQRRAGLIALGEWSFQLEQQSYTFEGPPPPEFVSLVSAIFAHQDDEVRSALAPLVWRWADSLSIPSELAERLLGANDVALFLIAARELAADRRFGQEIESRLGALLDSRDLELLEDALVVAGSLAQPSIALRQAVVGRARGDSELSLAAVQALGAMPWSAATEAALWEMLRATDDYFERSRIADAIAARAANPLEFLGRLEEQLPEPGAVNWPSVASNLLSAAGTPERRAALRHGLLRHPNAELSVPFLDREMYAELSDEELRIFVEKIVSSEDLGSYVGSSGVVARYAIAHPDYLRRLVVERPGGYIGDAIASAIGGVPASDERPELEAVVATLVESLRRDLRASGSRRSSALRQAAALGRRAAPLAEEVARLSRVQEPMARAEVYRVLASMRLTASQVLSVVGGELSQTGDAGLRRAALTAVRNARSDRPGIAAESVSAATDLGVEQLVDEMVLGFARALRPSFMLTSGLLPELPRFPWKPPRFSDWQVLDRSLYGGADVTLGDVFDWLQGALEVNGFRDNGLYAVPGGFALVTRLERIRRNGASVAGDDRWTSNRLPLRRFDLVQYLTELFMAPPGDFRLIAFVVTPERDLHGGQEEIDVNLAHSGGRLLPPGMATEPIEDRLVHVLIYHFQKTHGRQLILIPSPLDTWTHLSRAGVAGHLGQL